MPKTSVTAIQRVREFPTDNFVAEKGKLLCTLCSECINFEKKNPFCRNMWKVISIDLGNRVMDSTSHDPSSIGNVNFSAVTI